MYHDSLDGLIEERSLPPHTRFCILASQLGVGFNTQSHSFGFISSMFITLAYVASDGIGIEALSDCIVGGSKGIKNYFESSE
jgi:hypothetical protein